jgi:hypothetical protein
LSVIEEILLRRDSYDVFGSGLITFFLCLFVRVIVANAGRCQLIQIACKFGASRPHLSAKITYNHHSRFLPSVFDKCWSSPNDDSGHSRMFCRATTKIDSNFVA